MFYVCPSDVPLFETAHEPDLGSDTLFSGLGTFPASSPNAEKSFFKESLETTRMMKSPGRHRRGLRSPLRSPYGTKPCHRRAKSQPAVSTDWWDILIDSVDKDIPFPTADELKLQGGGDESLVCSLSLTPEKVDAAAYAQTLSNVPLVCTTKDGPSVLMHGDSVLMHGASGTL